MKRNRRGYHRNQQNREVFILKTSPEMKERAAALVRQMTLEEKLRLIVETAEPVERLGIPKYYHGNEALHGVVRPGKFTVFPQAIAFGAV